MKKDLKKRWIAALRGKKFIQARATLYDGTGHCCLGVLYCVHSGRNPKAYEMDLLSSRMLKKVGLTQDQQKKLAGLNDEKRWSFRRIAGYIERYL